MLSVLFGMPSRVAGAYMLVGIGWIAASNWLAYGRRDDFVLDIIEGVAFVLATGAVLLLLLRRYAKSFHDAGASASQAMAQLHEEIGGHLPLGLIVIQLDDTDDPHSLRIVQMNAVSARMSRVDPAAMAGELLVDRFPAIASTDLPVLYARLARDGGELDLGDVRYGDDRLQESVYRLRATGLSDRRVAILVEDVSERRALKDELRRLNVELEERIALRTTELSTTNEQLKKEIAERDRAQTLLQFEYALLQVLADAESPDDVIGRVLQQSGEGLGCRVGLWWRISDGKLRLEDVWTNPRQPCVEFVERSTGLVLARGEGLPGAVWVESAPRGLEQLSETLHPSRLEAAVAAGLNRAVAFPVLTSGMATGVIEFFGADDLRVDADLLRLFDAVGRQIGGFMATRAAAAELRLEHARVLEAQRVAGLAYWEWSAGSDDVLWSERLQEMIGASDGSAVGREAYLACVHGSDVARVTEVFDDLLHARAERMQIEHRLCTPSGEEKTVLLYGELQRDAYGRAERVSGTVQDITERKRAEDRLAQSERRFAVAFRFNPLANVITSISDDVILDVNDAFLEITGHSREEIIGRTSTSIGFWSDPATPAHIVERLKTDGNVRGFHFQCRTRSGDQRDLQMAVEPIMLDGKSCALVQAEDVTERMRIEHELRLAETAVRHMADALVILGPERQITSVNPAFERMTGYTAISARRWTLRELIYEPSGRHDEDFFRELVEFADTHGYWEGEIWCRRRWGNVFPQWLRLTVVRDDAGRVRNYVAVMIDISEEKEREAKLEFAAYHDTLTALPNRQLLTERCEQAVVRARRTGGEFALLFVDLDHFKPINDTYGHAVGDEVLKALAARMKVCVRATDTVARLGGDEFVVLLDGLGMNVRSEVVAANLIESLSRPMTVGDVELAVSASVGVSVYPRDGEDADTLLQRADAALYAAKDAGRGVFRVASGEALSEERE